ncbi:Protein of unknown function, partial [Cotesia congregata]
MSGIYALIFWTKSKQLQTIKTSCIPVQSRYENASVMLKWKNEQSKLFEVLDAKILKISDDKDLLDNISVDENTGRIFDVTTKAFLGTVLMQRTNIKHKQKKNNLQRTLVQVREEEIIADGKTIFDEYPESKLKKLSNNPLIISQKENDSLPRKSIKKKLSKHNYE